MSKEIPSPLTVVNPLDLVRGLPMQKIGEISPAANASSFGDFLHKLQLQVGSEESRIASPASSQCNHDLLQFFTDLSQKKSHALSALDAWGKPESGIFQGNTKWLGRYYECRGIKAPDFSGKYCTLDVQSKSPMMSNSPFGGGGMGGLSLGVCFPATCSDIDIQVLANYTLSSLNSTITVDCPVQNTMWNAKDIAALIITSIFIALVVTSTLYEYIMKQRLEAYISDFNDPAACSAQDQVMTGKLYRILTSFSIIKNTKKLLDTTQRPTDITCLHGMRFISMSWVILGHCLLTPLQYSNNPIFYANYYLTHGELLAVSNGFFSVDTFFFLSGLLVVYIGLRKLQKSGGKMNILTMFLYRYLRLTPAYAFTLMFAVTLWVKLGDGPTWPAVTTALEVQCEKYWWTNLLYINNLYPSDFTKECIAWSWYLSNDTQFYLLAIIILLILYRSSAAGLTIMSTMLLASISITGGFSSYTKGQPLTVIFGWLSGMIMNTGHNSSDGDGFGREGLSLMAGNDTTPPQYSPYISDLYAKPWCRIGAYIVGMITGYILYANNNRITMPKWAAALGWILAATMNLSLVYAVYGTIREGSLLDNNVAALYNALSRPLWCLGCAWVVVACVCGYGGPVNSFLSWKAFIPLSRLTYCTYLVHLLAVMWLLGTHETPIHFNMQELISLFITSLVLGNLLAYVLAMLVEFPLTELMKIILEESEQKRSSSPPRYSEIEAELRSDEVTADA
ncbi:unnamed protein product [Clavelina lepadiformis]|uniref:Nose resistant-to-fluoxetine protein N-terminal domain-containing protein n=1 Tax=Clavelina lepadiformis TaxID=159417 RepID=A0ABP0G5B9_CLALP